MATRELSRSDQPTGVAGSKLWIASIFALVLSFFWTRYTANVLVQQWQWTTAVPSPPTMRLAQFLAVPLMSLLIVGALRWVTSRGKALYIPLAYLLWFGLLFLSMAPGGFSEDTFYTFHMVRNGWWSGWYSALHPAFITALVQIFPLGFLAPGLALALLWTAVFASFHRTLFLLGARRWQHIMLPLLLVTPPMLTASTLIIRDSYFTALFLFFLNLVFRSVLLRAPCSPLTAAGVGFLAGALCCYRTESAPSVLLGVAVLAMCSPWKGLPRWAGMPATLLVMALPVALSLAWVQAIPTELGSEWHQGDMWDVRAENEYKLTLIENPLGFISRQPSAHIRERDRKAIEKVFKLSDLSAHYCPSNACVFYGGYWNRTSTPEERDAAYKAALHVFKHNPRLFLESRLAVLAEVGSTNTQTSDKRVAMAARGYPPLELNPVLTAVGRTVSGAITGTEAPQSYFGGPMVWWNAYLWGLLCVVPLAFVRRTPASAVLGALLTARNVIVLLASPASFSIYYLAIYIGGPLLLLFWVSELRLSARHAHARAPGETNGLASLPPGARA